MCASSAKGPQEQRIKIFQNGGLCKTWVLILTFSWHSKVLLTTEVSSKFLKCLRLRLAVVCSFKGNKCWKYSMEYPSIQFCMWHLNLKYTFISLLLQDNIQSGTKKRAFKLPTIIRVLGIYYAKSLNKNCIYQAE